MLRRHDQISRCDSIKTGGPNGVVISDSQSCLSDEDVGLGVVRTELQSNPNPGFGIQTYVLRDGMRLPEWLWNA